MFKINKKNLILYAGSCLILVVIACSIPRTRAVVVEILKSPFKILNFVKREVSALIFFHKNYYEIEKLKLQKDLILHKLNDYEELKLENERLKKLLSLKADSVYKYTAAKIIARDPSNWASTVIIDKGQDAGLKKGMIVINY